MILGADDCNSRENKKEKEEKYIE